MTIPRPLRLAAALLGTLAVASAARAQAPADDARDLASRVLAAAGGISPGEIVMLDGGLHTVPFMEAVAVEVMRAGGVPAVYVRTDRLSRAYFTERPGQLVAISDSADAVLYGHELGYASVFINFPQSEDSEALWQEMSADTARMRLFTASWARTQPRIDSLRNRSRARFVYVNYPPTRSATRRSGMDAAEFTRMQWSAVTTDQQRMTRAGRVIADLLERGRMMRITTANGTDLRIPLAGRPPAVNAGVMPAGFPAAQLASLRTVSLPGGQVSVAPLETGGAGRAVLRRSDCGGGTLVNARFQLQAGRLVGFSADSGAACVTAYLSGNTTPADRIGYVLIGLNPGLHAVAAGSGYFPWSGSGIVHLGIGNNADLGGNNSTPAGMAFAIVDATLEIDGQVVLREGRLDAALLSQRGAEPR
jgi:aminopeptidase